MNGLPPNAAKEPHWGYFDDKNAMKGSKMGKINKTLVKLATKYARFCMQNALKNQCIKW